MTNKPEVKLADPVAFSKALVHIAHKSHHIISEFLARHYDDSLQHNSMPPLHIGRAFMEMMTSIMMNPAKLVHAQLTLWSDYIKLWQHTTQKLFGKEAESLISPPTNDRRFKDPAWDESIVFNYIKQSYLLTTQWILSVVRNVENLDNKTAHKVDFYTRQFLDVLSPSNFILTNPTVLRTTLESGGENLVRGLENLLKDLERSKGQFRISMTDYDAFEVGRNIAITPGQVIYQNDLMQLIQYTPTTEQVYKRPLLIVPPWINKYYILDLQEKNSLIKWLISQGITVFVISWVNPDATLANKSFDDYMTEGPLTALDVITEQTGETTVNALGYCLGGTLLAMTLAYMAAHNDQRIQSGTYFNTMLDFSEPGELEVFIDEEQIAMLEQMMNTKGFLDGTQMATVFNMLRANDLIWSFVVNNYLLGKTPFPFDLLYWNADSTRMPAMMHSWYLRNLYQHNRLAQPNALTLKGTPIDLGMIKVPSFFLSTHEDHITPWKSSYAGGQMLKGPLTFTLASSGHIAGIINPPAANKYWYWTSDKEVKEPDVWLNSASRVAGSWWPSWGQWYSQLNTDKVPFRDPTKGSLKPIEEAPGAYVKMRI